MSGQTKIRVATIRNTLLAGVAAVAFSAAAPNAAQAQDGSFFGFVEGRYLMTFGDETDVGAGNLACDILIPDPVEDCFVTTHQSDTDHGVGGKVKLGFRSSGAWDVAIAGSGGMLDGDNEHVGPNTGVFLVPFGEYTYVSGVAESETKYAVADLEIGYNVGIGDNGGNVRLFVGARYADFDQDTFFAGTATNSFYSYGPTPILSDREVEFKGVGPRVGVGLNVPLGNRFSIAAEVSGSVLFGERETTDFWSTGEFFQFYAEDSDDDDDIVPNAEGNVGLSFVVAGSHPGPVAEITLGYHAEAWFGVNNTEWDVGGPCYPFDDGLCPNFAPDSRGVAEDDGDQYIHGPFVRIGIRR